MSTRREFIRMMAASVAGGATVPPAIARALQIPASHKTGTIADVEHVVILMQENRSFDHYFGTMRGVRGFGDPRPAPLPDGSTIWHQPAATVKTERYHDRGLDPAANYVLPFYLNPRRTTEFQAGTDHGWSSGHLACNDGRWNQWVQHKQDVLTMGYLRRQDVSFHWALANAFTLCDGYFCSVHGDTCPNRIYLWSGTIDGANRLGIKKNGPGLEERAKVNGYTWTTYPERLQNAGVSWKLYQGGTGEPGSPTDNYTDNSLEFFAQYQVKEGADPHGPLVRQGVSDHTLRTFREDIRKGSLPQVSWIVPPYKYCEHPEASPTDGAYFLSLVMEALTGNPEVWSRTVLFINYDENDGLFDHVVPPMPPTSLEPGSRGLVSDSLRSDLRDEFVDRNLVPPEKHPLIPGADPRGLQPIGLGPRVPMLVVSPWSTGGWVNSQVFDHTSVLQFLEKRFQVKEPNISAWRRAVCGDLTTTFDFSNPGKPSHQSFPAPAPIRSLHKPYSVPKEQTMPTQEPGTRPARALPYMLRAECRVEDGLVWIDLLNEGRAGAAFQIYDRTAPESAPRRYTVAAGDTLHDYWKAASKKYDLLVHGPNGFLVHQAGEMHAASPVVSAAADADLQLKLTLRNPSSTSIRLRVTEAYSKSGPQTVSIEPKSETTLLLPLKGSFGWHDVMVLREDENETYVRRFAGHLENGSPSMSDPFLSPTGVKQTVFTSPGESPG